MSSIATTNTVLRNSLSSASVLTGKYESLPASDDTPVVFVVGVERPEKESLELLIRSNGGQPQTLGSVDELFTQPPTRVPSCLILCLSQDCSIFEIGKRLMVERPEIPIILITSVGDVRMAVEAMKAGAIDFFLKPFSNDVLLSAIGESLERSRAALNRELEVRELRNCYGSLSRRERQVMALVVSGLLNKQVGGELGISEITVKAHRRGVMQKMQANSLPQLVRMAAELAPQRKQSGWDSAESREVSSGLSRHWVTA
jgi:FixJ family two-component response regulator